MTLHVASPTGSPQSSHLAGAGQRHSTSKFVQENARAISGSEPDTLSNYEVSLRERRASVSWMPPLGASNVAGAIFPFNALNNSCAAPYSLGNGPDPDPLRAKLPDLLLNLGRDPRAPEYRTGRSTARHS